LYSSTLGAEDLKISEEYNKEGIAFQYDFLNDDVELFDELLKRVQEGEFLNINDFKESKLYKYAPSLIQGLLNGRKLLFLINPPYGTSGDMTSSGLGGVKNKEGISNTEVGKIMKRMKVGGSSQQLYGQFLYRIGCLENMFNGMVNLCLFCPSLILTGSHFKWIRNGGMGLNLIDGFIFKASEFADVKDNWAISTTLWTKSESKNNVLSVKSMEQLSLVTTTKKTFYDVQEENKLINFFSKKNRKSKNKHKFFTVSNAINITDGECLRDKESMGVLFMDTLRVEYNDKFVSLLPSKMKGNKISIEVFEDNIAEVFSVFTARRLITGKYSTWINSKDEYMIPNIQHEKYQQWENDSIIYSLFNTSSNQSSLRDVQYNGKSWDIVNHFFFMSEQEIKDLAQGKVDRITINNEVEKDINQHGGDRFVYDKIKGIESVNGFSDDAQAVLDKARELVAKSFKYRKLFAQTHPQYQIETWDAGWYQVKAILKEYMKDELDEFNKMYKEFENRMRPLVYELGFLYE
jgi:hypothetical protein